MTGGANIPTKRHFGGCCRELGSEPREDGRDEPGHENVFFKLAQGNATSYQWQQPVNAVACEGYLGKPFAKIPSEMELKKQKQECGAIVIGFLKNLAKQIKSGTPVTIAVPAWLRENRKYERLEILDEIINHLVNSDYPYLDKIFKETVSGLTAIDHTYTTNHKLM